MLTRTGFWIGCAVFLCAGVAQADFVQDFSTDTAGWIDLGGGVTHNGGPQTATVGSGGSNAYTQFGGYNFGAGNAVPTVFQEYATTLDIYLDVNGGWANDTRFDWSSAINNAAGTHNRDFIFNVGFYNDGTGPGANTNRFVISASNNSQPGSAFAKNPGRGPIAISTSGWYTFEHRFYDNAGILAVDMQIYDGSSTLVNSWTLSDPTDAIGGIGGNRYGWIDFNQFSGLEIDNTTLTTTAPIPEPATISLLFIGLGGFVARRFSKDS